MRRTVPVGALRLVVESRTGTLQEKSASLSSQCKLKQQAIGSPFAGKGAAAGVWRYLMLAWPLPPVDERKVVERESQSASRRGEGGSKRTVQIASLILHHPFVCLAEISVGHRLISSPRLLACS